MAIFRVQGVAAHLDDQDDIEDIDIDCVMEKKHSPRTEEGKSCYCRRPFADEFRAIIEKHGAALPGACLFCFRAGKPDFLVDRNYYHSCEEANAGEVSTAVTTK
jgi:hypothetical protein